MLGWGRETEVLACERSRVWDGGENRGSPHCCHGNTDTSNCAHKLHCVCLFLSQSPRTERNKQSPRCGAHPQRACTSPGWALPGARVGDSFQRSPLPWSRQERLPCQVSFAAERNIMVGTWFVHEARLGPWGQGRGLPSGGHRGWHSHAHTSPWSPGAHHQDHATRRGTALLPSPQVGACWAPDGF